MHDPGDSKSKFFPGHPGYVFRVTGPELCCNAALEECTKRGRQVHTASRHGIVQHVPEGIHRLVYIDCVISVYHRSPIFAG